jgi:hypothetical protein
LRRIASISLDSHSKDEKGHLVEHKEDAVTCEESMGNANEYKKLLEPPTK